MGLGCSNEYRSSFGPVAGYSGTPLAKKLGIKPEHRLAVLGAPDGFAIPDLPDGVEARTHPARRAST